MRFVGSALARILMIADYSILHSPQKPGSILPDRPVGLARSSRYLKVGRLSAQIENVRMTRDPSVLFDAERVVHERAGNRRVFDQAQ